MEELENEALRDFDRVLKAAIGETVSVLLGQGVLAALHQYLGSHHSISSDALPAHLQTLRETLQRAIGFTAATTVERAIARTLYSKLNIRFKSSSNLTLQEYVDEAKRDLAARQFRSKS